MTDSIELIKIEKRALIEACAKIADKHADLEGPGFTCDSDYQEAAREIAHEIRLLLNDVSLDVTKDD